MQLLKYGVNLFLRRKGDLRLLDVSSASDSRPPVFIVGRGLS
jgi:hypothetical protein